MSRDTLCWSCARPGTSTCAWDCSKATEPVEGWEAEKRQIKINDGVVETYCVISCPEFIPGKGENAKQGNRMTPEHRNRMDNFILGGARTSFIAREIGVSEDSVRKRRRALFKEEGTT